MNFLVFLSHDRIDDKNSRNWLAAELPNTLLAWVYRLVGLIWHLPERSAGLGGARRLDQAFRPGMNASLPSQNANQLGRMTFFFDG